MAIHNGLLPKYFVLSSVSNVHYLIAFLMEKLLAQGLLSNSLGIKLQIFHLLTIVIIPYMIINIWPDAMSLLGITLLCIMHTIMFLKIWSYAHVNYWCRSQRGTRHWASRRRSFSCVDNDRDRSGEAATTAQIVQYPDNLKLGDLYYFLVAPTLCYELNFPRSERIRKSFLLRRMLEVIILSNILLALFQQWIIPTVKNSFKPFSEMDYMKSSERLLKLAIPCHLLWLIWFYAVFHSFLNIAAELLRFSDRNFYQDWWNAKDVSSFWRLWNMPVHKWAARHIFIPMMQAGYGKDVAGLVVFFVSAFFHEYMISVPLRMYKVLVFIGMLLQVVLVYASTKIIKTFGEPWGNVIVWASLMLGQPLGILVYYYDYVVLNFDLATLP